jgi:hypothetical protein
MPLSRCNADADRRPKRLTAVAVEVRQRAEPSPFGAKSQSGSSNGLRVTAGIGCKCVDTTSAYCTGNRFGRDTMGDVGRPGPELESSSAASLASLWIVC